MSCVFRIEHDKLIGVFGAKYLSNREFSKVFKFFKYIYRCQRLLTFGIEELVNLCSTKTIQKPTV